MWNLAAQDTLELHEIVLGNYAVVEPVAVHLPNANAVETERQYKTPSPAQVPALDGVVNYIAQ